MEGNNNNNMCDVCGSGYGRCGKCGNMCGFRGNHLLRWFLGIIIITWVFSIGMRFGELKAELGGDSYGYGYRSQRMMPMMYGWQGGSGNVLYTQGTPVESGTVQIIKK